MPPAVTEFLTGHHQKIQVKADLEGPPPMDCSDNDNDTLSEVRPTTIRGLALQA